MKRARFFVLSKICNLDTNRHNTGATYPEDRNPLLQKKHPGLLARKTGMSSKPISSIRAQVKKPNFFIR